MTVVDSPLAEALRDRYTIERELGRGGMATVYLARDLKHGRLVALKVLRPELATAIGSERFLREIQIAARLAHPHILPLLDSGAADTWLYYTMPYVEGETLRAWLAREKQLPLEDGLRIALEVADALQYAHAQGVVHRDIKPENILIEVGHAVVSDFGIARAVTAAASEQLTVTGLAIGSPVYMSPEQATAARQVDGRSDIYSLGCVVYEMIAGHPPFWGDTPREVLARHALDPVPPLRPGRPDVPEAVERAVMRALAKSPADRYQSATAFVAAFLSDGKQTPWLRRAPSRRAVVATFLTLSALAIAGWLLLRERVTSAEVAPSHSRLTFSGQAYDPAISPDGRLFAYGSDSAVLVQDFTGGQPLVVHRTGGIPLGWSPDGSELLFGVQDERHAAILTVSALGGMPRRLWQDSLPQGLPPAATWSPDGSRVAVACGSKVCLINKWTAESVAIAKDTAKRLVFDLDWSDKTDVIAFIAITSGTGYAVWTITTDGAKREQILEDSFPLFSPRWSADGRAIYYLRGGEEWREIWKVAISPRTGRAEDSPSVVASGLQPGVRFALSADGARLLYAREARHTNLWLVTLQPGAGQPAVRTKQLTTGTLSKWGPSISPDGSRVAFTMGDGKKANVYTMGIEGDSLRQVTFFNAFSSGPVWSPDGRKLAFGSIQGGEPDVWIADAQGGNVRRFPRSELAYNFVGAGEFQLAWAPDSAILYQHPSHANFRVLDPRTGSERWLVQEPARLGSPRVSPTGKLLALRWARPQRSLWLVSLETGAQTLLQDYRDWFDPLGWSPDERWIYVLEHNSGHPRLTRVPAQGGPLQELAPLPFLPRPGLWGSMSPDGNRFVVENWEVQSDVWMVEHFDR